MIFRSGAAWSGALGCLLYVSAYACGSSDAAPSKPSSDGGAGQGSLDAGDAQPDGDGGPQKIADQHFGDFKPWASPIDDYLAVGQQYQPAGFNQRITDLAPLGDRLHFGYGDADYNLGEHTPIELRYFASPDDPTAKASLVDGAGQGEVQTTPYQTGEEQIDRFRTLDGELWQAGIDSIDPDELYTQAHTTPKGIQGNAYRLDVATWRKHRSINGGEHVHDLASFRGAIYAVGSGADTRTEFEAGEVYRYLWRSDDRGVTFSTVQRLLTPFPGHGDSRFVHLLSTASTLYVFGYTSEFISNQVTAVAAQFDGQTLIDVPVGAPLERLYPAGTLALPDGSGLLYGADLTTSPLRNVNVRVAVDGSAAPLSTLVGSTLLDVSLAETGELVYLTLAGDEYAATPTSWELRVLVADASTPDQTTELLHFTASVEPACIAWWKGSLFLGTSDGKVLRADAQ